MADLGNHCPFLNRADRRCSTFFSIEQIQHTFEHCFHAYSACEVYQELLLERQIRRAQAAGDAPGQFVWATACKPAETNATTETKFVQVRIPSFAGAAAQAGSRTDRYAEPAP